MNDVLLKVRVDDLNDILRDTLVACKLKLYTRLHQCSHCNPCVNFSFIIISTVLL